MSHSLHSTNKWVLIQYFQADVGEGLARFQFSHRSDPQGLIDLLWCPAFTTKSLQKRLFMSSRTPSRVLTPGVCCVVYEWRVKELLQYLHANSFWWAWKITMLIFSWYILLNYQSLNKHKVRVKLLFITHLNKPVDWTWCIAVWHLVWEHNHPRLAASWQLGSAGFYRVASSFQRASQLDDVISHLQQNPDLCTSDKVQNRGYSLSNCVIVFLPENVALPRFAT